MGRRSSKSPPMIAHDRRRWGWLFAALAAALSAIASSTAFLSPPPSARRRVVDDLPAVTIGRLLPLPECASLGSTTRPRHRRVSFTTLAAGRRTTSSTATEEDPYAVLGIPRGTTDAREIKRAYRRMAMRYHPDVAGDDVDPTEANERFVRINAAYELLSGKTGAQNGGTGRKSGTSSTTTTGGAGYTPPHRRSGPYSPPSGGGKTYTTEDWRDYMPKDYYVRDDDDEYDADGDSFTAIFSDLIEGIAAATASGGQGGILTDLIEFLEGNFPEFVVEDGGIGGGSDSDGLESILRSNDFDLIKDEMDDATLLVQQLETKLGTVERDIARLEVATSEGGGGSFATRMEREAELEELRARRKVVEGYVKRARKRLLRLQTKVKEMRDSRSSGGVGGGGSGSGRGSYASSSTRSRDGGVGGGGGGVDRDGDGGEKYWGGGSTDSYSASVNAGTRDAASTDGGDSTTGSGTERESFGSFGRGRGRSRSRNRSASSGAASRSTSSSTTNAGRPGTYSSSSSSSTRSSSTQRPRPSTSTSSVGASTSGRDSLTSESSIPPHRRSSPSWKQEREEKKRLRELQVDDEFDKLKKELGL